MVKKSVGNVVSCSAISVVRDEPEYAPSSRLSPVTWNEIKKIDTIMITISIVSRYTIQSWPWLNRHELRNIMAKIVISNLEQVRDPP